MGLPDLRLTRHSASVFMSELHSAPISSRQSGVHEQLPRLLEKHAATPFRKPIADFNRVAFEASIDLWRAAGAAPLILDTGCGVGWSTRHLALQYSDHFVIGIDQSADRLARQAIHWPGPPSENLCFVRADLVDYWRLLLDAAIFPARQYLLYPNPWPKIGHLARRWHGHAVFPSIVALGGQIECRSNWRVYVEEFAAALNQLGGTRLRPAAVCTNYLPVTPMTPFERKYLASGHALWRCQTEIAAPSQTH